MDTLIIKTNNEKALKILENLEALNIIEIIKKTISKPGSKNLSDKLTGCISEEQGNSLLDQIAFMKNEWKRDI